MIKISGNIIKSPAFSLVIAVTILYLDYVTGPEIQFPVLFIIPVIMVTWYNNFYWGIIFSILLPVGSIYCIYLWGENPSTSIVAVNTLIRIIILLIITYLIKIVKRQQEQLSERINNLEKFLPICSFCKKIRDKDNSWHQIESYITEKTDTEFSHSICPDCAEKHYGKFLKK